MNYDDIRFSHWDDPDEDDELEYYDDPDDWYGDYEPYTDECSMCGRERILLASGRCGSCETVWNS